VPPNQILSAKIALKRYGDQYCPFMQFQDWSACLKTIFFF
jgi:hypothetical protein